jgi:hypothetical protein
MNDRGSDRLLLGSFLRHGREQLPPIVLQMNRVYAMFDASIQDQPTGQGELAVVQALNREQNQECLYDDLVDKLKAHKLGPRQANIAISSLRIKNNLYFIGTNGDRIVRLLTPQARAWLR